MKKKNWRYQDGDVCEDEYAWDFLCSNCDEHIYIFIKKGIAIKDIISEVQCENCGVLQSE